MSNKRYIVRAPNGTRYAVVGREGLSRQEVLAAVVRQNPDAGVRTYQVRANDGNDYEVRGRPGLNQTQVRNAVHARVPEADIRRNALGAGMALARNALTTGLPYAIDRSLGTLTPEEERRYLASQRAANALAEQRNPGGVPSTSDVWRGRVSPLGFLAENLGQSVPQMGATIAGTIGGGLIGTASGGPGVGTAVGAVVGGTAVGAPFFAGTNVDRATEGGNKPLTRGAAARSLAAAPFQAAGDAVAQRLIPGLSRVAGGSLSSAGRISARGASGSILRGTARVGEGAVAGGAAEAGQQFGERYSAGLPLGDAAALEEYRESAVIGGIMDAAVGTAMSPLGDRRRAQPEDDGTAPPASGAPANAAPANNPPTNAAPANSWAPEGDVVSPLDALSPEQRVVFDRVYEATIEEGLVSSDVAVDIALQAAGAVPETKAKKARDAANVPAVDGRAGSGSAVGAGARGRGRQAAGVAAPDPAGAVGGTGGDAAVDLQGQGDVDPALTTQGAAEAQGDVAQDFFAQGVREAAAAAGLGPNPVSVPAVPVAKPEPVAPAAPVAEPKKLAVVQFAETTVLPTIPDDAQRTAFIGGVKQSLGLGVVIPIDGLKALKVSQPDLYRQFNAGAKFATAAMAAPEGPPASKPVKAKTPPVAAAPEVAPQPDFSLPTVLKAAQVEAKAAGPKFIPAFMQGVNESLGQKPVSAGAVIKKNADEWQTAYSKGWAFGREARKGEMAAEVAPAPAPEVAPEPVPPAPAEPTKAELVTRAVEARAGAPLKVVGAPKMSQGNHVVTLNDGTTVSMYRDTDQFGASSPVWYAEDALGTEGKGWEGYDAGIGSTKAEALSRLPEYVEKVRARTLETANAPVPDPASVRPASTSAPDPARSVVNPAAPDRAGADSGVPAAGVPVRPPRAEVKTYEEVEGVIDEYEAAGGDPVQATALRQQAGQYKDQATAGKTPLLTPEGLAGAVRKKTASLPPKKAEPKAKAAAKPKPKATKAQSISETVVESTLTSEDRSALAKHFGYPTYSAEVLNKFVQVVVKAASGRLAAAHKAIKYLVDQALAASLAVGLIFNPMGLSPPNAVVTVAQVEASIERRAELPDDAAGYMSEDAQAVYERMAPVATDAGAGFMIMDKPNGELHLFRADGSHIASTAALSGASRADEMSDARMEADTLQEIGSERVTRAGTFTTRKGTASTAAGWVLRLDDAAGESSMVAIHTNVLSDRQAAIESATSEDNAITMGCISMDADFYAENISDNIDEFDDNLVFVMPHDTSRSEEFLPGKVEEVVVQKGGVQEQVVKAPTKEEPTAPPREERRRMAQPRRRKNGTAGKKAAVVASKVAVSKAEKFFADTDPIKNPGTAANANFTAGNIANHMPMLKDNLSTMGTPALRQWLRVMPLSSMAEWGEKNVPGLMNLYHTGTKKIGQLHTYQRRFNEITKSLVAVAGKYDQKVISRLAYSARLNRIDVTELGETLQDSYDADKPTQWLDKELTKKSNSNSRQGRLRKARTDRMAEIKYVYDLWQELGDQKGGREAFLATQKFYKTMYAALRALNYSAMRRLKASDELKADLEDSVDRAMDGDVDVNAFIPQNLYPREYTPAKRFGEYWLDIAEDNSRDVKRKRVFATFDTAGERNAELRRLSKLFNIDRKTGNDANGERVVRTGNDMKSLQKVFGTRDTMLGQLFKVLDEAKDTGYGLPDAKQLEALKDQLFRTWLLSGAANSLQKNFLQTSELVQGNSQDLARVFGDSAMQYSSLLASAEYDHKVTDQIASLRENIKEQYDPDDQAKYGMFVEEMENRLVADYASQNGPNMFNSVNRAMFFYFLTAPATAATQWVSLPIVVIPFLGGEYGYTDTVKVFSKYMNFAKTLGAKETNALGEKVFSLPSFRNSDMFKKNALARKAYLAGAGRAVFETMVDVITSSAATPSKARKKGERVKNAVLKTNSAVTTVISAVYTSAELVTREVAYMTAFELHYKKTGNFDASVDAAVVNVNKSMGSYLDIERPTFMKHASIRSLMAFKQYSIAMTKLYMDLVAKIATPESVGWGVRITAAKQLAGITVMGALLGGVPATMVFGVIGGTLSAVLKGMFSEEDKEEMRAEDPLINPIDNFEAWFRRKWLPDTFGTGMGDLVENGVISELTGADFSSRLSNSNMWFRNGKPGDTRGEGILNTAAANIPPLSMAMSVFDATTDFQEGRVLRGLTKISPAFIRGGVNAILLAKQGIESPTTGDTSIGPEELDVRDIVSQALGFVPMRVSDWRKEAFAFQGARTEASRAKTDVMSRMYKAMVDEDADPGAVDRAYDAIERHNRRYPREPYYIDDETLERSITGRYKADERTYRGMLLNKDEEDLAPVYETDR